MNGDAFLRVAANVSTVVDLLEDKGISWSEYMENLPFSGYEGFSYPDQHTGANNYVRKHNPLVIFDSVASKTDRLAKIKNFTLFYEDLKNDKLPQWMFITPNEINDGHDTNTTFVGSWTKGFVEPLLKDPHFMSNTVLFITFDENESYPTKNRVWAVALGDAVPPHLVGTKDSNYYNHYSEIATVEANWGLHHLGRWDAGANVLKFVAEKTGDVVEDWDGSPHFSNMYWNLSYAGFFNSGKGNHEYPRPNLHMAEHKHHRSILPSIFETWKDSPNPEYYKDTIKVPDGLNPPPGYAP
jgi:acid phosphatase